MADRPGRHDAPTVDRVGGRRVVRWLTGTLAPGRWAMQPSIPTRAALGVVLAAYLVG